MWKANRGTAEEEGSCPIHINVISLHIGESTLRTNIDIDDRLMNEAMRRSGTATKKATVEAGLRLLVQTHAQGAIRRLRGKVRWEGDLEQWRLSRIRD
jgi:Arc/MetJ family transcription regulator